MSQQPPCKTAICGSEVPPHLIPDGDIGPVSYTLPDTLPDEQPVALEPKLQPDAPLITQVIHHSPENATPANGHDGQSRYPRLCQWLGLAGIASRRQALAMIHQGDVRINGQLPRTLQRVYPTDVVTLHGNRVTLARPQLWCYHKPVGIDCNLTPHKSASLWHELQQFPTRLFPIGRLDKDSSGLLLLTNQGMLAQQWLHPELPHEKEYWVQLDQRPSHAALTHFANGVRWQVGPHHYQSRPCQVTPFSALGSDSLLHAGTPLSPLCASQLVHQELASTPERWVAVVLTEGQHRQIRYMWRALGYRVCQLIRVRFNDVWLGDLAAGSFRELPLPVVAD